MSKRVILVSLLLSAPHISANWWSDLVASSGASLSNLTCAAKKATLEMTSCARSALADVDIAAYTENLTTEQKAAVVALALSLGGYAGYQGYKYCCSSPETANVDQRRTRDGRKNTKDINTVVAHQKQQTLTKEEQEMEEKMGDWVRAIGMTCPWDE